MGIQIQANAVHHAELRDLFPASVLRELALVIDQTVNRAGGVDAVSSLFNTNKGRVSEWSNPDHPHWPNLRQIINLERFAKVDWITQAMAALHGADLVKRGSAEAHGAIIARLAVAAKEMGEALSSSAEPFTPPAFLTGDRGPIRPHCLKPEACAGVGRTHCHTCTKAAAEKEAA